ncbi:diaminopimelate decarboxylase [Limnothrix sp. FACHB-1083]|uniref:diaminopimelate decarboxylase n=1 Tax=unclassified Limnothrix TaxID=2632864 RepID=UPI001680C9A3|nr:diaminopimelate decarboxylase [Limnothrix sp. FACHB-1088]MBD2162653.1 diaminopimelate decarboxylase [Limnothrix sp. FACHB-1083]MBD2193690.1 diaminopimelate decarboxylase [Limnothrix sp. FACHB-1088]
MVATPAARPQTNHADQTDSQTSSLQYLHPQSEGGPEPSPNQLLMPLTARVNDHDHLEVGGCDVVELLEQFGSPLYILDEEGLRAACRQYRDSFKQFYAGESQVLYASKAWSCLAICAIAQSEGLGVDVVSAGEILTALRAGTPAGKIYLHGNNKSRAELELAVRSGCNIITDNWLDLHTLASFSASEPIRVMVRITPGIECHTHEYIRTGHIDSKFGFDPTQVDEVLEFLAQQPHLHCIGLHAHIGSQIFELQPHSDLTDTLVQWFVKAQQLGLPVAELNVGGGLGIRYTESDDPPSIEQWVQTIAQGITAACDRTGLPLPKLLCEPGRSLVGSSCLTAYRVGSQKTVPSIRTYVSVDGGMSDNPRPITYQSLYRSVVANRMSAPCTETVTVAGKHCESGDVLIRDAQLPALETGDVLVVLATGAYNASMASNYNRVPRPAAVLVRNGQADLILERETDEDLLRFDRLPDRLQGLS